MDPAPIFLEYAAGKIEQQAGRIRSCLDKLTEDQIWARGGENENAAGNLVLHLCGNIGQWIGAAIAGQPDVRVRDREFAARDGASRADLIERLAVAVSETAAVLRALPASRLDDRITVQGYDATVLEAIFHVVEHFSYHTGQIVFLAKAFTGEDMGFYRHLNARKTG